MAVEWTKCEGEEWCRLLDLDLTSFKAFGVYVIWSKASLFPNTCYTVYVGQGKVQDRLDDHRKDSEILRHGKQSTLYATWAKLPSTLCDGAERYLAEQLQPVEGDRHPDAPHVVVNLPDFHQ